MFLATFVLILYFDWLLGPHKGQNFEKKTFKNLLLRNCQVDESCTFVTCSRAKPQQTPSVEKHAHPPRVVYCAIYLTLTLITKFRVSNLHITTL